MNDTYVNAIDHLKFDDISNRVISNAATRHGSRFLRIGLTAAALLVMLGTSVFAAGEWFRDILTPKELGMVHIDIADAVKMELAEIEGNDGVSIHCMALEPGQGFVSFTFRNGLLYSQKHGFYRLTQDYTLEHLEYRSVSGVFQKNGMTYQVNIKYVDTDGGIFTQNLKYIPVKDDVILTRAFSAPNHNWPVYVNLKTGEIRDALPGFDAEDFDGSSLFCEPFRDGILITTLVDQSGGRIDSSYSLLYWVKDNSNEAIRIDLPEYYDIDYIEGDMIYVRTINGNYYQLDESFKFQTMEDIPKTNDGVDQGLLTVSTVGTLGILDLTEQTAYTVKDLEVWPSEIRDGYGYNASRNSDEGRIAVTHSENNLQEKRLKVDMISVLDTDSRELLMLEIESEYDIRSYGWLDDDRYAILYCDGVNQYLYIYEFS